MLTREAAIAIKVAGTHTSLELCAGQKVRA